jgi:hypothetical protein
LLDAQIFPDILASRAMPAGRRAPENLSANFRL